MKKLILFNFVLFILSGCQWMGSQYYNISADEWSMIDNQLAVNLFDRATQMVNNSENFSYDYSPSAPQKIQVKIDSGRCKSLPYNQYASFEEKSIKLSDGQCQSTLLTVNPYTSYCTIRLCYKAGLVHVDNGGNSMSTILMPKTPLWAVTQEYHDVTTRGFAHLDKVNISVTSL